MNRVLKCLYQWNLLLKLEKYKFYKKKVNFLSFIIRQKEIHFTPDKIQIIKK